jgi:hypothetical protein
LTIVKFKWDIGRIQIPVEFAALIMCYVLRSSSCQHYSHSAACTRCYAHFISSRYHALLLFSGLMVPESARINTMLSMNLGLLLGAEYVPDAFQPNAACAKSLRV